MTCRHVSIQTRAKGNQSTCIECKLPIIFTGEKWEWEQSLDPRKIDKLKKIYLVNMITSRNQ